MDADERQIYQYLKPFRKEYISTREICRRAGGRKRFHEEPEWAKVVLGRMVERGILELDAAGRFRIKPRDLDPNKQKKWASPEIQRVLLKSGANCSELIISEDELDNYYDNL